MTSENSNASAVVIMVDGRLCVVEPAHENSRLVRRVFRQMISGQFEWAALKDVEENGTRARWYGYAPLSLPPNMLFGG